VILCVGAGLQGSRAGLENQFWVATALATGQQSGVLLKRTIHPGSTVEAPATS
jgi:hypothetical protein